MPAVYYSSHIFILRVFFWAARCLFLGWESVFEKVGVFVSEVRRLGYDIEKRESWLWLSGLHMTVVLTWLRGEEMAFWTVDSQARERMLMA